MFDYRRVFFQWVKLHVQQKWLLDHVWLVQYRSVIHSSALFSLYIYLDLRFSSFFLHLSIATIDLPDFILWNEWHPVIPLQVVAEILTSLRRALPSEKSVTCKIRMLPSTDAGQIHGDSMGKSAGNPWVSWFSLDFRDHVKKRGNMMYNDDIRCLGAMMFSSCICICICICIIYIYVYII